MEGSRRHGTIMRPTFPPFRPLARPILRILHDRLPDISWRIQSGENTSESRTADVEQARWDLPARIRFQYVEAPRGHFIARTFRLVPTAGERVDAMHMGMPKRARRRGFTLIELLITLLIMAILMAVAVPLYLAAVSNAEITTCRANMQAIANADQAYRARSSTYEYTTDLDELPLDLGSIPVCPGGGEYSITISDGSERAKNGKLVPEGGLVIHCSVEAHGVFAPGVDGE